MAWGVLADLLAEAGNLLGEPRTGTNATGTEDGTRFLNSDLTIYLNWWADEINARTGIYKVSASVNVVAGTAEYQVKDANNNAPIGLIRRVENELNEVLPFSTREELDLMFGADWQQTEDRPSYYYLDPATYALLGLYPKPAVAGTYTVWFPAKATPMIYTAASTNANRPWDNSLSSGNPTAAWAQQYARLLPGAAAYEALKRDTADQDLGRADKLLERLEAQIQQVQQDPLAAG